MSKCPACKGKVPAYQTKLNEVKLLCVAHTDELNGKLREIIAPTPNTKSLDKHIEEILEAFSYGYSTPSGKITKDEATQSIRQLLLEYSKEQVAGELKRLSVEMQEHMDGFEQTHKNMSKKGSGIEGLAPGMHSNWLGRVQAKRLVDDRLATLYKGGE